MKQPVDLYGLLMDATNEYSHAATLNALYAAAARDGAVAILVPTQHSFLPAIKSHVFFMANDDESKEGFLGYFYTLPVIVATKTNFQNCVVVFRMNAYGLSALEKL